MERDIIINKIFKTLYIYEDSILNQSDYYSRYIKKLYVLLAGLEDDQLESEALIIIKGLVNLGMEADHRMVKSSVFKVINMVKK